MEQEARLHEGGRGRGGETARAWGGGTSFCELSIAEGKETVHADHLALVAFCGASVGKRAHPTTRANRCAR